MRSHIKEFSTWSGINKHSTNITSLFHHCIQYWWSVMFVWYVLCYLIYISFDSYVINFKVPVLKAKRKIQYKDANIFYMDCITILGKWNKIVPLYFKNNLFISFYNKKIVIHRICHLLHFTTVQILKSFLFPKDGLIHT